MQFSSPTFGVFLLAFVVLFHALRRYGDLTRQLVIVASIVFYASWSIAYVPVLVASTLLTFYLARAISNTDVATRKRRLLTIGVAGCLGLLAIFKYANFLLANVYAILHVAGWDGTEVYVDLFFPIGISFYTFVNVGYLVDVYRKQVPAKQRLVEYLAPMTFFPQLLSGPIVRAPHQFPQFARLDGISSKSYRLALLLVFVGLAKKTLAGLLDPIASSVFEADTSLSQLETWTGVLAYMGQIYADFSGYTDLAIGIALLVGIELPPNFNLPYLATSPIDFWRRWHMTLSAWIHDYTFLPLVRRLRWTYVSLLVTWILIGLWHGAQWTFVAYGLYNGIAIIATRWIGMHVPESLHERADMWPLLILRHVTTFVVMMMSFIVFRCPQLTRAGKVASSLFTSSRASKLGYEATLTLCLVTLALVVPHVVDAILLRHREPRGAVFWPLAIFATSFAILFGTGTAGYIYFGF